jgi:site-specific DNA-methyltransferase (adenine-specific)
MDYITFNEDAETVLNLLGEKSIDLVVTSPPYDSLRKYNEDYEWNIDKCKRIISGLYRVLKPGGVVVWVVGDQTQKGSETGSSFKQALAFMEGGFLLNDTMIWRKTNPMPQVKQPRYNQVFEYMFVFSKGKPKTFNPIMVPCKCSGQDYNSTCKNMGGENGRTKKSFKINKEKVKDNVWDIAIAQNHTSHPAVFPLELAVDHVLSWSNEGDVVLDPFMGSGTTGIAAIKNGRTFVGCEISKAYYDEALERLKVLEN